jgi:hypothetical protein
MDEITDIKGSESLEHEFGERFRGWYVTRALLRKESVQIGDGLSYSMLVCDHRYQFIMPSKIEFYNGIYTYSESERRLGVFRFPVDSKGEFCTPVSVNKDIKELSPDEVQNLLKGSVLTFEAFRIPYFGFEFFYVVDHNFREIERLTGASYLAELKKVYEEQISIRVSEVKSKILSLPNNLLILENILNLRWKNFKEVAVATNNIIYK